MAKKINFNNIDALAKKNRDAAEQRQKKAAEEQRKAMLELEQKHRKNDDTLFSYLLYEFIRMMN